MRYYAIAIIDSENESLKNKIDQANDQGNLTMEKYNEKWKGSSFEEILNDTQNKPGEIKLQSAYLNFFAEKLKKPLAKIASENFDDYSIDEVMSVERFLKRLENGEEDRYPIAIMTPNCHWLKQGWDENIPAVGGTSKKENELEDEWNTKLFEILNKYKEKGIVVLINCDS